MKPISKLFEAREEITKLIPETATLFNESIFDNDEWYDNDEHNLNFFELPEIVVHALEEYETPYYARVISINNQLVKTYHDEYGFQERHISTIFAEELSKILLYLK